MLRKFTLALLSLLLVPLGMMAQNVTISPQNGSMICSDATGQGTKGGAFSMWRHEQLALTMIASGSTALTDEGILKDHRNWFNTCNGCTFRSNVTAAQIATYIDCGWQDANGYYTISLPKGYRFTGYRFELSHDITNTGQGFTTTTDRQVVWAETGSNFGTAKNSVTLQSVPNSAADVQVYTLTRRGDDMGNVLYFKATTLNDASGTHYYDLTFRYVELTFTADADAPIDIKASTQVSSGQSMIEVPFNTGKVDLGEVTQRAIQSAGNRISYSLANFKDMAASMLLYEAESVHAATGTESFDGTNGDVAYNKAGSITTTGNYFKLNPGSSKEQVYYLESPVYATMQNGGKNPIQFRIVGANVEYNNGSSITYDEFTLSCVYRNNTYYIGNGYDAYTSATNWFIDEEGYVRNGDNYLRLVTEEGFYSQITYVTITTSKNNAQKFKINGNKLQVDGGTYNNYYVCFSQQRLSDYYSSAYWRVRQENNNQPVLISKTGTQATTAVSSETGNCTLKVYGADGKTVVENGEVTVNSSRPTGTIPLTGLNNDAIKFSVQGTGYVKFNVILQALNPYVDQMSVVMNDEAKNLRMTQTFTSDDFSVGGDTFLFYLPEGCIGDDITMTFEDLYSKYGDDTYDHTDEPGTSDSRYNFVMSQHHQAFTSDNIYNNSTEAANDTKESVRIAANNGAGQNVRTQVGTVGNIAFRFNNADELSTTAGYMTEFPFTLNNYANQTNPGAGSFVEASFPSVGNNAANDKKTFYVFTTDETKYNIAPTTATQHRSYAFYEMEVQLICADYSPTVTFEKIYSNSFNETGKTEFYGANVSALVGGSQGLAADFAVNKAIAQKIATGGTDIPASMDQILYLDMSNLKGVFHSDATKQEDKQYEVADFNVLKSKLAKNALVFLPINSTSTFDNFAYALKGQTESSLTFKAANNIILTDKNPFYTPYTIQVDAAKSARYTRQITKSTYSGEAYATVIMPFEISLVDGQHVDEYGTLEFLQMNEKNATADDYNYMGKTIFFSKTNASKVEANTPYALHVVENKGTDGAFTVNQKGSNIIATPEAAKTGSNSLFSATAITSTGNLTDKDGKNATYTFSHKGSFSGYKIPKETKTFYFANNGFYSSVELNSNYTTVDLFPFRSVYEVVGGTGSAKVGFLRFFEGENDSETDGINALNSSVNVDMGAPVYDMQGRMIAPTYREAKSLQSGMYVVNGVKIIVK